MRDELIIKVKRLYRSLGRPGSIGCVGFLGTYDLEKLVEKLEGEIAIDNEREMQYRQKSADEEVPTKTKDDLPIKCRISTSGRRVIKNSGGL